MPATGPLGNSYRLQLPAGTVISLPTQAAADQVRAVAVNEIEPSSVLRPPFTVRLTAPLQLVSPAYMAERNATEINLLKTIAELRAENTALRSK